MELEDNLKEIPPPMKVSLIYPNVEFLDSFEFMEARMNNYSLSNENIIQ